MKTKRLALTAGLLLCLSCAFAAASASAPRTGDQPRQSENLAISSTMPSPAPSPPTAPPPVFTSHCMRPPRPDDKTLYHYFGEEPTIDPEVLKHVNVLVGHGAQLPDGGALLELGSYYEHVPVFVSEGRALGGLSHDDLVRVLSGQITDWQQLGAGSGPIHLYLHGGELQKLSFRKLAESLGVQPESLSRPGVSFAADYKELAARAGADPNALVIGLRDLRPDGLKTVDIDGLSVLDSAAPRLYPLRVPIFLYRSADEEGLEAMQKFLREVKANNRTTLEAMLERGVVVNNR